MTDSRSFMPILRRLRENIILYIDEKQGIDENYVITNEKEFLSGLKKTVYKPLTRAMNMKKCFEAGVFKILIKDNVCYIYTDLTTATQYLSGKPLILRKNITYVAASLAHSVWKEGDSLNVLQRGGYLHGYGLFLGKPDLTYLTLFTREMNDLYRPVFVFGNTPPISLMEIP
jgi:hypothetical protein